MMFGPLIASANLGGEPFKLTLKQCEHTAQRQLIKKLTHAFSIPARAILQRQNIEKNCYHLLSSYLHAKPSLVLITSLWQNQEKV